MAKRKQTLIDILNEQDPNEIIYLGANKGTNWLVIDKASNIIKNMEELNKTHFDKILYSISTSQNVIDDLPSKIIGWKKDRCKIKNMKNEENVKKAEKLDEMIYNAEKRYACAVLLRNKQLKVRDSWVHLNERLVVDIYEHETDVIGTCVLIKGTEAGNTWFYNEGKE